MKKLFLALICSAMAFQASAGNGKDEIVKTGLNFGPLPAIAFDADKGFQYGAILQIYNYGDGHNYPNYNSYGYIEYSRFTKGSQLFQLKYDDKELIPGVRWSSALRISLDSAYDFYGYNGYQSYYDQNRIDLGKKGEEFGFNPFYRMKRNEYTFKSDFTGNITSNLKWEAGVFARYFDIGSINYESINKGKEESNIFPKTQKTLFDIYKEKGLISEEEQNGGIASGFRLGLMYDSRNKEGAPSHGVWAEAHVIAAPDFMNTVGYYRYSLTWRHYLPIVSNDVLTFAYRLNYEGNFGKKAPFYVLPYMTIMGERSDAEGMGGYGTARGIIRSRVVGLDMAAYTAEFRWRFVRFPLFNQNIAFALNFFSDGAIATRGMDLKGLSSVNPKDYGVEIYGQDKDSLHSTIGSGLRFIMNENFIVALEYGMPLSHLIKNSPVYNQDGTGAMYINLNYTF